MAAQAYEEFNAGKPPYLLFLCDHASNTLPASLGTLGLTPEALASHIAYDIGAAALTRALGERFGAPAFLGRFSRLAADLNRGADDPTAVAKLSDGRIIPGNLNLDAAGIRRRIADFHTPYHCAIDARIDEGLAAGIVPALLSIHSFTPDWRGEKRPWHIGILSDRDKRLAKPLLARFARVRDWTVGNNEPYTGMLENDCMYRHGTMRGLPHALIEVRQDLITDEKGVAHMAERLAGILGNALADMGEPALALTRPLKLLEPMGEGEMSMDEKTRTELEAAVFRRLVAHLRKHTDVQNIDMMNLAGFCRNCLGDWYREAAAEKDIALEKDDARELVYGMKPDEWKKRYQKEASPEQLAALEKTQKTHS